MGIPLVLLGSFTATAPPAPATGPGIPDHLTGPELTDHSPPLRSSTDRGYVDPTTGDPTATRVIRAFDKPEENWLPGHRGVDLALSVGSDVLAAGDGTVAFAGPVAGTPTISIDHSDGVRTTYQPVHSHVREGDPVTVGQTIGRLAHPSDGRPGLNWGARRGEEYLNPLSLLAAPVIRLKPVDEPAGTPPGDAAS